MDVHELGKACLAKTPGKDRSGAEIEGAYMESQGPLYCGLPQNHEGPHAWEGMCASAGAQRDYLWAELNAVGYTATWEETGGGPGGHLQLSIEPKRK